MEIAPGSSAPWAIEAAKRERQPLKLGPGNARGRRPSQLPAKLRQQGEK